MMRGIILAAGRGSRMGRLTDDYPKCLTPLAGKPLLQWQIEALQQAGVSRIALVRGYLAHRLQGPHYTVFDNRRWSETNMVMSLVCAQAWLEEATCIVSYADIVYHPAIVQALMAAKGDIALTFDRLWYQLWSERFDDPLADAESFQLTASGDLKAIGARVSTVEEIEGQYMGLLKFTPHGWRQVRDFLTTIPAEERDALDMTGLLRRLLEWGVRIQAVPVEGRWCEVDSETDLELYERRLHSAGRWSHDWRPGPVTGATSEETISRPINGKTQNRHP